jgi:2-methylisocitrate lyase-like PEP mutase family enzyme
MLAAVARVVRAVAAPVTADMEAGYGLERAELAHRLAGLRSR